MANIKMLPSGYATLVKEQKADLLRMLKAINASRSMTYPEQLRLLPADVMFTGTTAEDRLKAYVGFDYKNVSSDFVITKSTGRWSLCNTCTVFIGTSDNFVDNYKW